MDRCLTCDKNKPLITASFVDKFDDKYTIRGCSSCIHKFNRLYLHAICHRCIRGNEFVRDTYADGCLAFFICTQCLLR